MGLRGPKKGAIYSKTIAKEKMRERLRKRVAAELDPLITSQIDKAKGCLAVEKMATGGERVYRELPDTQAFKILAEQAIGKPKEEVDVTSNGETIHVTEVRYSKPDDPT